MNKTQLLLTIIAVLAVIGIYNLPKVVVDNDRTDQVAFLDEAAPGGVVDHSSEVPEEVQPSIAYWKEEMNRAASELEANKALDSLMAVFEKINKYDSAAYFAELHAEKYNTIINWQKAGDAYYEAFTFALEQQKINRLGAKSRSAYDKVLAERPNDLDVKHNVAMTLVGSSKPMEGIMMLREILEKDPANEKSLMSMGLMSIRTNQFANGIERFETLVKYYPNHVEGNFFLGVCYYENGDLVKARAQFEKVKKLGTDEQIITAADEYLERIS